MAGRCPSPYGAATDRSRAVADGATREGTARGVIYGCVVQAALDAFARHSWHEAYTLLTDAGHGLDADQFEMLAVAANLIGRDQESVRAWERASCRSPASRPARPGGAVRVLGGARPVAAR